MLRTPSAMCRFRALTPRPHGPLSRRVQTGKAHRPHAKQQVSPARRPWGGVPPPPTDRDEPGMGAAGAVSRSYGVATGASHPDRGAGRFAVLSRACDLGVTSRPGAGRFAVLSRACDTLAVAPLAVHHPVCSEPSAGAPPVSCSLEGAVGVCAPAQLCVRLTVHRLTVHRSIWDPVWLTSWLTSEILRREQGCSDLGPFLDRSRVEMALCGHPGQVPPIGFGRFYGFPGAGKNYTSAHPASSHRPSMRIPAVPSRRHVRHSPSRS